MPDVVLYLHSQGMPDYGRDYRRPELASFFHLHVEVPDGAAFSTIPSLIRARVGSVSGAPAVDGDLPHHSVKLLVINSHGSPGIAHIGEGLNIHTAVSFGQVMKRYMRHHGGYGVELQGCGIAASTLSGEDAGFDFLRALHRAMQGLDILAGSYAQRVDEEGQFEGGIIRVRDGQIARFSGLVTRTGARSAPRLSEMDICLGTGLGHCEGVWEEIGRRRDQFDRGHAMP